MKNIFTILLFFFIQNIFANDELDKKAQSINKKIRCVVCQGQSIDESDSILARDLRNLIKNKLKEGENEDEITNYIVERYGEFVLLKPRFNPKTYLLLLSPIIFLFIGLFLIKGLFRKK